MCVWGGGVVTLVLPLSTSLSHGDRINEELRNLLPVLGISILDK